MDKPSQPSHALPPGRSRYRAVIVSPHLDDAVFSCGGRIAQLVGEGPVLVLNLFTRYLSDLKIHGAVLGDERYEEEASAARFLGFESRNLGELDAPFRRDDYRQLGNLFRPPIRQDLDWLPTLRAKVFAELAKLDYQELYVPLGVGWHVDHVVTHMVFEPWAEREHLLYYEDAPYCGIPHSVRYRLNELASYPRRNQLTAA
ncbi:MAG: PIG-L family deacetylase [Rhodoferax sp.]|nr:PIG-L family deacetylase [Rhodoferax sp.]